jgi:GH24 family phage-related lysozyme (muramidase)
MGRFDGTLYTRAQLAKKLETITLPNWIQAVAIHHTYMPDMKMARETPYKQGNKMAKGPDMDQAFAQRMRNFLGEVNNRLGGTGWHFTTFENGKFGEGEPLNKQSHAHRSWNDEAIAIESAMNGDGADPSTEGGRRIMDSNAWLVAQILKKRGLPANASTVRYHREEPTAKRDGKSCPGHNYEPKDNFIRWVQGYMDAGKPQDLSPGVKAKGFAPKAEWSTSDVQDHLKRLGYDPGPTDGDYGLKTEEAVKYFQRDLGVVPTGVMGPFTWNKLRTLPPKVKLEPAPAAAASDDDKRPIAELHCSEFCIDWMKRFEGLRLEAYDDRGTPAIGYGHNATSNRSPVPTTGMKITLEEADRILHNDAEAIAAEVRKVLAGAKLKQHQFDALVLDFFQRGQTQATNTSAVIGIKAGAKDDQVYELLKAQAARTKDKGLSRRRLVEALIWNGDKPTKW